MHACTPGVRTPQGCHIGHVWGGEFHRFCAKLLESAEEFSGVTLSFSFLLFLPSQIAVRRFSLPLFGVSLASQVLRHQKRERFLKRRRSFSQV